MLGAWYNRAKQRGWSHADTIRTRDRSRGDEMSECRNAQHDLILYGRSDDLQLGRFVPWSHLSYCRTSPSLCGASGIPPPIESRLATSVG